MKILVFGSLNIDKTYSVDAFVKPGQTISAVRMEEFCGGKGFNQAIALRRAGNEVFFGGAVGRDGGMLLAALDRNGVDRRYVKQTDGATGHAVIQLDARGQNCIIILAGANGENTEADAEATLSAFGQGDLIVLQNEISCVPHIIRLAHQRGMRIAFNPSPNNGKIADCDLTLVDYLLVNEEEGAALSGKTTPEEVLDELKRMLPSTTVVLTLGGQGSMCQSCSGERFNCGVFSVKAVDTTAAGDTFTGYFLSEVMRGQRVQEALETAAAAASIAVSRKGAEPSIPMIDEVRMLLTEG